MSNGGLFDGQTQSAEIACRLRAAIPEDLKATADFRPTKEGITFISLLDFYPLRGVGFGRNYEAGLQKLTKFAEIVRAGGPKAGKDGRTTKVDQVVRYGKTIENNKASFSAFAHRLSGIRLADPFEIVTVFVLPYDRDSLDASI